MRQGYSYLLEALAWLGQRSGRNLDAQLGGVLPIGRHKGCQVVERISGNGYVDYIFQDPSGCQHRQRVWKGGYKLGATYDIEIGYGKGHYCIGVTGGGEYTLNKITDGAEVYRCENISGIYRHLEAKNLRLAYRNIVGSMEVGSDEESKGKES